jgi:5-methyltetrahydropteroyltriglutamate--homocysteine S-methyltransferase
MLTHNLGYPRIGSHRELKQACERYWAGRIGLGELLETGRQLRRDHWLLQQGAGIDLIPCNDFSFYDQVLDMSLTVGAIPERYEAIAENPRYPALDLYFAMARGYQKEGLDLIAMEMTKWFDTNYHYLVPEFHKNQSFRLRSRKVIDEFCEARALGLCAKPVLIGPVSYLWLGKEKEAGFHHLELLERLLPVYAEVLCELNGLGAEYVQLDEPFLAMDLSDPARAAFVRAYGEIHQAAPRLKIILATYFEGLRENTELAVKLPVHALHLDLVRAPGQLDAVLEAAPRGLTLSLGVVDGRNIWKNDFECSQALIRKATDRCGSEHVMLAPSCSLLHVPCDLGTEPEAGPLPAEVRRWLAFALQKLDEVGTLARLAMPKTHAQYAKKLAEIRADIESRRQSSRIRRPEVQARGAAIREADTQRQSPFTERREKQRAVLHLPLFPTTTIGSFPQTGKVREWRARRKRGEVNEAQYEAAIRAEIEKAIRWQESVGLDVLVHGEFERNDMVEYFGERLAGFAFTANGWVQSYGSRCVKPPILYDDVERKGPMTVAWTQYAQSLTERVVKGMLTGPVTILQWSFVRDDQPRAATTMQIALAIRDEVQDLEKAGIRIIQIDEPALREGLPLRKADWEAYLQWAVKAFRVATSGVADETQIHTHMCYSEFNDIIAHIAALDADVITIETSRSQMELLDAFVDFQYPNEIGPGVYDIHSLRVPQEEEIMALLHKALTVVPAERLWVNPDCGLKTRLWPETRAAIATMVTATRRMRAQLENPARS